MSDPVESAADGTSPAIAFDGTNYLVVWAESRNYQDDDNDIRGARITPSGNLLDPTGFAIASGVPRQVEPAVAFGGGTFLVAWTTSTPGASTDVVGARVSRSGAVLDPSGISIATGAGDQSTPSIAFGGGVFLVAWADWQQATDAAGVFGARLDPSGRLLGGAIPIATGPAFRTAPAVAFGAAAFLVVWAEGRLDPSGADVFGARVDATGLVLDPSGIAIATGPAIHGRPAVAFDGTVHLVVWEEGSGDPRIRGARVSPSGSVLDPFGITLPGPAAGSQLPPAVTAKSGRFLVGWYAPGPGGGLDLLGARVDSAGTVLDPSGLILSSNVFTQLTSSTTVALASNGWTYFAVWEDERAGVRSLFGARISAAGVVAGPGTLLSRSASRQGSSAVGFDGVNHLVVWSEGQVGGGRLVAGRLSPAGRMLEPVPFVLSGEGGSEPEVAFDGENHLVVWSGAPGGTAAVLVSPEGFVRGPPVVLPTQDIPIGPDVASDGSGFLVTWNEVSRSGTSVVRAARIDADGALLDPSGILVSSSGAPPSVASDGLGYLVTWARADVRGRRVGADGSLTGPEIVVSTAGGTEASVAWNGQRYLVVWTRFGAGADSVLAARVTGAGSVQDPAGIPVASGRGVRSQPAVAANGPFLVAWRQQDGDRPDGLYGVRIGDDGVVRDPAAVAISVIDGEREPSLSRSTGADWAVTYSRFRPESPYAANRVFLRTVAPK